MTVQDALSRGDLREAIDHAGALVRERPLDHAARFTLIDLLSFAGDWARASKQLAALTASPEAGVYDNLIRAGRQRAEFFMSGQSAPSWLIEPPAWADRHLAGCDRLRRGDVGEARLDFDAVDTNLPELRGMVAGAPFEGLRDLDDRFGPVLELAGPGGYHWVAWEDVRFLDVAPPTTLRDLIWVPARLALAGGPIGRVYLPTLYPGSEAAPEALALGRETDWRDLGSNLAVGLGLKVTLAGERSLSLFELRDLQLASPTDGQVEPA